MTKNKPQYYQQKLEQIKARNLNIYQRFLSLFISAAFWLLLFLLAKRIQYVWVPYVVEIQKFSHLFNKYITYFFATLFIIVWFYLIYRTFNLALRYLLRALSGVKEK